jgi:hypothetical protein
MSKLEDFEMLQAALDNDKNESISKLTYSQIKRDKNDILQSLQFKSDELKSLHHRLNGYRYIENGQDVSVGSYVRWISLKTPDNLVLTNGAYVCGVYYTEAKEDDDIISITRIRCKTTHGNRCRFFILNVDENVLFQKLTDQERIILDAFKFIEKHK